MHRTGRQYFGRHPRARSRGNVNLNEAATLIPCQVVCQICSEGLADCVAECTHASFVIVPELVRFILGRTDQAILFAQRPICSVGIRLICVVTLRYPICAIVFLGDEKGREKGSGA